MKIFLFTLFIFININSFSQTSTNTGGGVASSSDGTVSFSIGQVLFLTNSSSGNTVKEYQGIQLPYEVSVVNNFFAPSLFEQVSVFPNPTNGILKIDILQFTANDFSYQVLTEDGKILVANIIVQANTTLDLSKLASAIYFIKIKKKTGELKTYKIIKNQ